MDPGVLQAEFMRGLNWHGGGGGKEMMGLMEGKGWGYT